MTTTEDALVTVERVCQQIRVDVQTDLETRPNSAHAQTRALRMIDALAVSVGLLVTELHEERRRR